MIHFILNNQAVETSEAPGLTLLDFIRYKKQLTGTKIGCREGDCGACTVLVGELDEAEVIYKSVTSCLMPIANANRKHIVTVEGINGESLNAVQQAMSDEGATQCGFCTPGFVMSLAGYCLQDKYDDVVASIDGNICRCTGYKSIERAGQRIADLMRNRNSKKIIQHAVETGVVPEYFLTMHRRLMALNAASNSDGKASGTVTFVGGGTDLYVQKHEEMVHADSRYVSVPDLKYIKKEGQECIIGAAASVTDLAESKIIRDIFPDFSRTVKLVSSTPIRNMATIGGNFVNASPIGDFTVFFLALNARIVLSNDSASREVGLRDFYLGYKKLAKNPDEYLREIRFEVPAGGIKFNFEKVSKRTHLDIASVNSAIAISGKTVSVSAGGVGPVPMYLRKTSEFLSANQVSVENIHKACGIASDEISPISDVRGSAEYKRLLLQQLIKAHFVELFPDSIAPEKLLSYEEH